MRRFVTILVSCFAILLLTSMVFAGEKSATEVQAMPLGKFGFADNAHTQGDTLFQAFFNCNPSLFLAVGGGFVAGNNAFGDLEKAQLYEGTGGGNITEFVVWVGDKTVGSNGNVVGKIYDVDGSGEPGQVLGTSTPVTMENVNASNNVAFTAFVFPDPVAVGDDFFCSVELSQSSGDTIGIVSTDDGCTAGSNTSANAWELFSDGTTFVPFDDASSWGLVVDMAIFPVFQTVTSVDDRSDQLPTSFALDQNYPNPFNPSTRIGFALPENSEVTLKIYNLLGQEVAAVLDNAPYQSGHHKVTFDASALSNGIYFYKIEAGSFIDVRKMTLLK